jgi:cytochrome c553
MTRRFVGALAVSLTFATAAAVTGQQSTGHKPAPSGPVTPAWAYPVNPSGAAGPAAGAAPAAPDEGPKQVPASAASFTLAQIRDGFNVADWFPGDHAAMPDIVSKGRRPDVRGCGFCHLPNGLGRPENSALAGLPAAYIVQQMADYKAGLRKSSEPRMGPAAAMLALAKSATDEEIRVAADYFASLKPKPWIRVVEAATVPKTRPQGFMLVPVEGGGTEPIGHRIIEMPEDLARTELRDPRSGFVAYVPVGSIKRGEDLVRTGGNGKTIHCGLCHGADMRGLGPVPGIAGRSPSYMVRQLWDMQQRNRVGVWSPLMQESVSQLTEADMVAIAAYLASRTP